MAALAAQLCISSSATTQTAPPPATELNSHARPIARRVLVLFGWDEKVTEKPATWPIDTLTGELLQTPLEWLGYEVIYHDIGKAPPPSPLPDGVAAIITDGELDIPPAQEDAVAEWLLKANKAKIPLLFAGAFPFSQEEVVEKLKESLGLNGSTTLLPGVDKVHIKNADESFIRPETPVTPRQAEFHDLQAPDKARVFISLTGENADGTAARFDPVYLTSWGGMWLEPYVALRASADNSLFYADPYVFLSTWLKPLGVFPAPDTSTRDGRRMFYSHIDGDGFASTAEHKGHPLCSEVIRDRILKVFPFPITVSVVTADIQAVAEGLDYKNVPRFLETARSIFALPNVQVASHTFSHPYIWEPKDPNPGVYDEPALPIKPEIGYPRMILDTEIKGSVDYINKELAPKGKLCELVLWSGNCRPGPAAIRAVRELGLENLNGGNTIISRLYPGISGVAPRTMWWDNELQVYASNQNEFMYANGFNGPFYGGFADVIDTFERTETPRRLKPVNAYYHFYSATYLSSLRAVEKIHAWAMEQKLHSVTAKDFVQLTRDSQQTEISELGPRHWLIRNEGWQRTFRLPAWLGKPDLKRCKGVTGYNQVGDQIFIHTSGQRSTEIAMTDSETPSAAGLYLVESSADIAWRKFSSGDWDFRVKDFRPVEMIFGGLSPGASSNLTVNGKSSTITADGAGRLSLTLPDDAQVQIRTD